MTRLRETRGLIAETSPFVLTGLFWWLIIPAFLVAVGVGIYWFVAPAKVAIDNRVFHQSQAYNDGMARDLDNMRLAYIQADPAGKDTIRATIKHRFAGYDASQLAPDLQTFLAQVRQ